MFVIINYVNSVFEKLPQNIKMVKLKQEILSSMEKRYVQLLTENKTQQQAIAQVLAELGNIDDFLIQTTVSTDEIEFDKTVLHWSKEQVEAFKMHRSTFSLANAIGVFLIFIAPAIALLIQKTVPYLPMLSALGPFQLILFSLIPVLILLAVAIGLFVHFSIEELAFGIEGKVLSVDSVIYSNLIQEKKEFKPQFIKGMVLAALFSTIGIAALLLTLLLDTSDSSWPLICLLSFMAIGAFLLVFFGIIHATYNKLLSIGDYNPKRVAAERLTTKVAQFIFPLATVIYVVSGLLFQTWSPGWMIFPILGIVFGLFAIIAENPHLFHQKK